MWPKYRVPIIIAVFVVTVLLGAVIRISLGLLPFGSSKAEIPITVEEGDSTWAVGNKLFVSGVIWRPTPFVVYEFFTGKKIIPGEYAFSPSQSVPEIADAMDAGRRRVVRITLIEGWRAKDMEKYLVEEKGLDQMVGFTALAEKYEGRLFPDTYEILYSASPSDVIDLLRNNFEKVTSELDVTEQQLILASIVEREASSNDERAQIAGVYANRLKIGMNLEADPTVQYAKGSWAVIKLSDYRSVISPYNTYLNKGLPPGPIANPGLKSIEAAQSPASHSYYYFFHADGQTYFSKSLEEHNKQKALYL